MVHAMNDYAAKAHSIWAAAAIPDAKSLDDSEAGNLGSKLRWAADWYRAARAPSRLEKEQLEKIERAAKKLDRLLAESPEAREKLDGFWLGGGSSGEDLRRATVGVYLIRRAARLAKKESASTLSCVANSLLHRGCLFAALRTHTKRRRQTERPAVRYRQRAARFTVPLCGFFKQQQENLASHAQVMTRSKLCWPSVSL